MKKDLVWDSFPKMKPFFETNQIKLNCIRMAVAFIQQSWIYFGSFRVVFLSVLFLFSRKMNARLQAKSIATVHVCFGCMFFLVFIFMPFYLFRTFFFFRSSFSFRWDNVMNSMNWTEGRRRQPIDEHALLSHAANVSHFGCERLASSDSDTISSSRKWRCKHKIVCLYVYTSVCVFLGQIFAYQGRHPFI